MSPRYPAEQRSAGTSSLVTVYAPAVQDPLPLDVRLSEARAERERARAERACTTKYPYTSRCSHSFFRDLLRVAEARARRDGTFEAPRLERGDPGEDPNPANRGDPLSAVEARLATIKTEARDLSAAGNPAAMKPFGPGWVSELFGQAARATGTLADALVRRDLDPGMVEHDGTKFVVKWPRLASGAAVAAQSAENAAVQETDPTTAQGSSTVGMVAGQVDMSRQLFDRSRPGFDEVVTEDLGRAHGAELDRQIVAGSGSNQNLTGLLSVSGILSVTGSVTNAQAFAESVWKAYSALAGPNGFGNPDAADGYITIIHPRRWAWLNGASSSSTVPAVPALPGRVVFSAGVPSNLGAGSNEDVVLVVEKSSVILAGGRPQFRVFESVGSDTGTVRISSWNEAALITKSPVAVAKVTGLTPPTGF